MTIGQKIRIFCKRAGLSQLRLEMEIRAASGHVSRFENSQINPTKEVIKGDSGDRIEAGCRGDTECDEVRGVDGDNPIPLFGKEGLVEIFQKECF